MQLPGPLRAFVGLIAVTAEEAKHLPDRAIELPMLAVSSALQMSLRAQQRYARLTARGDDVISRRPAGDEAPSWATFDDPVPGDELRAIGLADPDPAQRARAASQLLDELLGNGKRAEPDQPAGGRPTRPATKASSTKAAAQQVLAKNAGAKKAPTKAVKAGKAVKAPTKAVKAVPPAAATKKQPAKRARNSGADKSISAPRHTAPSRFDTVEDD